jgi:thiol-disulfide isomerase/thioredoxin
MTAARRIRRCLATVTVALVATVLAGCSSDLGSSGEQGYVAGRGVITTLPAADRQKPGEVAGTTLDGDQISLDDYAGDVVVVNVWGSWCSPCRSEAPMLAAAARDLAGDEVAFLGIDSRDPSEPAARAFVRRFDIPYPSIYDQSGRTLLAFRDTLAPNAIPSTVIIDRQGRVAASVLGEITRTTLYDLVDEVSGTGSAGDPGTGSGGA